MHNLPNTDFELIPSGDNNLWSKYPAGNAPFGGGSSPTLFQDLSGRAFTGEAGALAVNDNWQSTVYDYVPQFAPDLGTIPTPTGNPSQPGTHGPNPNNPSQEYLVVGDITGSEWSSVLNNASYRYIFVAKGTDISNLSDPTVTQSGSEGSERYLLYWDPDNPSNVQTVEPWNQSNADKVQLPFMNMSGASYWKIIGMNWGRVGTYTERGPAFTNGASNNLMARCNVEYCAGDAINVISGSDNMFYLMTVHDIQVPGRTGDDHAFAFQAGSNNRMVSCEIWDFLGDALQVTEAASNGCIAEDIDCYRTKFSDGSGNTDPNGAFAGGEGCFDYKNLNPAQTTPFKAYGCRIFNMRIVDPILHPGGGSGAPVRFSVNADTKYLLDFRWGIIVDSTDSGVDLKDIGPESLHHSVVRSIIHNVRDTGDGRNSVAIRCRPDDTEIYLNTVVGCLNANASVLYDRAGIVNHDFMGNLLLDVAGPSSTANLGTGSKYGYNAHVGTYGTAFNKDYPIGYENSNKAAMNFGNFTFRKRKLTTVQADPEGTYTITGIVPTSSTPSGFFMVPQSGADQIGSRSGIGVDDDF